MIALKPVWAYLNSKSINILVKGILNYKLECMTPALDFSIVTADVIVSSVMDCKPPVEVTYHCIARYKYNLLWNIVDK